MRDTSNAIHVTGMQTMDMTDEETMALMSKDAFQTQA